jgi:hypothetical protein
VEVTVAGEAGGLAFQGRDSIRVIAGERAVAVTDAAPFPAQVFYGYELHHNYPDPLNPTTTIRYALPSPTMVCLQVFDIKGNLVRTLVDEEKSAGQHVCVWDGRSDGGRFAASGVYFYRITAGDFTDTKKMVILR